MHGNFKNIHIGKLIGCCMQESGTDIERAAAFLKVSPEEVEAMYTCKSLDCDVLLRWSKLLEYDFFRVYSQHLILYSPQHISQGKQKKDAGSTLPVFKKNIYTEEVILYLIGLVKSGAMTHRQIKERYNIPVTTILRWINKYGNSSQEEEKEEK
jgi:hypothetical protein